MLKETETERLYGLTHHIAKMWKQNIGKLFIRLVTKHFPKKNKYDKIFNLSPLKLSYCSTINVGNIIKQHNSKVLSKANDNNNRKCNCKLKPKFPLIGECLTQCLVYQATARTSSNSFVKGSSKHGITTVQNLSDTVNTWMRLNYQNMCGT